MLPQLTSVFLDLFCLFGFAFVGFSNDTFLKLSVVLLSVGMGCAKMCSHVLASPRPKEAVSLVVFFLAFVSF